MKIIIKVGTQSILDIEGKPIPAILENLALEISKLQKEGHQIILVSSGAVGTGRRIASSCIQKEHKGSIAEKQLLASLGQHELVRIYSEIFKKQDIFVSQILLTKQDFQSRQHYLNISRLLAESLKHPDIVPIINENDSVSVEELMFTDNDELAGLMAALINADRLIIFTNVDGVYTGHPDEPDSRLIEHLKPGQDWPKISSAKSNLGRGGMLSKLNTAKKMSGLGISTTIANINQLSSLKDIIIQQNIGTTILPDKKKSNIKRWIAYNNSKKMGSVYLNSCLSFLLEENKQALSLLPLGITGFEGNFKRGDLVELIDHNGKKIGIGLARYEDKKLREYLGQKNKPAFIHYDHLHLF